MARAGKSQISSKSDSTSISCHLNPPTSEHEQYTACILVYVTNRVPSAHRCDRTPPGPGVLRVHQASTGPGVNEATSV